MRDERTGGPLCSQSMPGTRVTSEKSVSTEQRLNALVSAVGAVAGNPLGSVYAPDPWHAIPFNVGNGWANAGSPYTTFQYRFDPACGDRVEIIGMITAPTPAPPNAQPVNIGIGSAYWPATTQFIPLMPAIGFAGTTVEEGNFPLLAVGAGSGLLTFFSNVRVAGVTYWLHDFWSMTA